ncbi:MAG: hypothetical protein BGO01_19460 [Armatimonadetes bacterium 55-13]|nr:sensor histidine kinase [Armatimonadota bacterium]OJU64293.1 MAG: hypothetical protein BGO01_19460 [Armatimonadetes bacterium 55-13]
MGLGSRQRHLIFLAHLWVCTPFALLWVKMPEVRRHLTDDAARNLWICVMIVMAYLGIRTYLAFKDPAWLKWDRVYPPIDVTIVSLFLYFADSNPLSNIALLYFLPIAEAAQTLSVKWAASVAVMTILGSITASIHAPIPEWTPFNIAFRFFFLILMSSLLTILARQAAEIRSRLSVEADRNRIALEMHDGLQGSLITAAKQMELAQMLAKSNPERTAQIAGDCRLLVRQTTDELRFLVQRMRSHELTGGFEPALRQYANNICERNDVALNFKVEGTPIRLSAEAENAMFRIAQEGLNNILRHSQAQNVRVVLTFGSERVELCLEDDGVGLPDDLMKSELDHSGLDSMKLRAEENGGSFRIGPNIPRGTKLEISLPRRLRSVAK